MRNYKFDMDALNAARAKYIDEQKKTKAAERAKIESEIKPHLDELRKTIIEINNNCIHHMEQGFIKYGRLETPQQNCMGYFAMHPNPIMRELVEEELRQTKFIGWRRDQLEPLGQQYYEIVVTTVIDSKK